MDSHFWLPAGFPDHEHRYRRDFGLIVRGPHPNDSGAMLTILAGRGSVGTEAACQAVTEQKCLDWIKKSLAIHGANLNNHQHAFWAVVEMERNNDELAETKPETLKVLHTNVFQPR
jgi:16S rRNA G966 N2-methylase RsmD